MSLSSGPKIWSTLNEICALLRINPGDTLSDDIKFQHKRVRAGQSVYRQLQRFDSLFIVSSGFLKTIVIDEGGGDRVTGFPMRGDLIGLDAIHAKRHPSEAVALTDCDVVIVEYSRLMQFCTGYPGIMAGLCRIMSAELAREQATAGMIATMSADTLMARFLAQLSDRYAELGYSPREFSLRMSRAEMGSYLGLTLESASRALQAIGRAGLLSVNQREVVLHDVDALKTMIRLPAAQSMHRRAA